MRAIYLFSISAFVLTGCLTTQGNPNYEQSTAYQTAPAATQQYASAPVTHASQTTTHAQSAHSGAVTHSGDVTMASHNASTTTSYPVFAHRAPAPAVYEPVEYEAPEYQAAGFEVVETAPTDIAYGTDQVTGTPGFMAMQGQSAPAAAQEAAPSPVVQSASSSLYGSAQVHTGAGTPINYDVSRNLVTVDALTTGQEAGETVRMLPRVGQSYMVQPGDTVYSLSRKTCVGVNVIQSMNGLGADYGIKIGQSLTLPASIC